MDAPSLIANPTIQPLLTATQLSRLLRGARKQQRLTQAGVGARLGLSQNRISHLEGHADEISVKQLLTWCAVVGLELSLTPREASLGAAPEVGRSPALGAAGATPPEW